MPGLFWIFLKLGLVSFGGPVAHLGYFRREFVERRRWLSDAAYGELVALAQVLPGPASSQVNLAVGLLRGGWGGAIAAWVGFTLPSALLMLGLAIGLGAAETVPAGLLAGLKAVAAAVVAWALIGMARQLTPDLPRAGLAAISAAGLSGLTIVHGGTVLALAVPAALAVGALVGMTIFRRLALEASTSDAAALAVPVGKRTGVGLLVAVPAGLAVLLLLDAAVGGPLLDLAARFYRTGALVFGGGHVVLPLLQSEVVAPDLVSEDTFLAGYGAAQALPGPLFAFAAFLGAATGLDGGIAMATIAGLVALTAIFLPGALLMAGALPFWNDIARWRAGRAALLGINAVVVGLLAAAFVDPVATAAITGWRPAGVAAVAFAALASRRIPVAAIVLVGGAAGWFWL